MRVWVQGLIRAAIVGAALAALCLLAPRGSETVHHSPGDIATLVRFDQPGGDRAIVPTSDEAIASALRWLAAHQSRDGGWNFDHGRDNVHAGSVRNAGRSKSRTGATAVCLVGFLAAGQTQRGGAYRETMQRGLQFLISQRAKWDNVAGDLRGEEGDVVCQAWSTLALCETYAQTQDKALQPAAQAAVQALELMRDPQGAWGRAPRKSGDLLTTARVIQALKSAHGAYLDVSPGPVAAGVAFLDAVQSDDGAHYGLTKPGDGTPATDAAGMLCRGFLGGWKTRPAALEQCVQDITQRGPLPRDLDYNDFALHVLQQEGRSARDFHEKLCQRLLETQVATGEAVGNRGSWATAGHSHAESGGRLYETAINLILLARRIHRPLINDKSQDDDF